MNFMFLPLERKIHTLDIICSSKLTVLLELRSRKTVRFSEQTMFANKYLSIFSRQTEAIVYVLTDFQNCVCCEKYLNDNKHNSPQLARKRLSQNCCPLGTDHVRGQISWHIFAPNGSEAIIYLSL